VSARRRLIGFTVLCCVCIAATAAYVIRAKHRVDRRAAAAAAATAAPAVVQGTQREPHVLFRTWRPPSQGMLGLSELDSPEGSRRATALDCERVDFAAGKGICLGSGKSLISPYSAVLLNADLEAQKEVSLAGAPSRARISPDGRLAAVTVFQTGHSYAVFGGFSTLTTIIDMTSGEALYDLEEFTVTRDGKRIHAADFNFWGITFTRDPGHFYATLQTGGQTFLIEGDARSRRARVLRENVECPSLSPDGTRLVFKKRLGGAGPTDWQLSVLNLVTGEEHPLAETRSVDDQAEWLDNDRVLYAMPADHANLPDVWSVPADGTGAPRLFLAQAESPAVVTRQAFPRQRGQ
jgi:hypothetical protein